MKTDKKGYYLMYGAVPVKAWCIKAKIGWYVVERMAGYKYYTRTFELLKPDLNVL